MYRIGQEEIDALARVINSRELFKIGGSALEVMHFQEELCEKMGAEYSILMTSGQGALVSALIGMGIGPGDEVIVPAYTYISSAMAVTSVGAIPVIAEIDDTLTLDPNDFEKKISDKTKAVIPVHIQGFPSNMAKICEIAKKHGVYVLEDACQSDGGSFKGRRLGTLGDAGAYSFNYFKIITAGEGGALITNNRKIFENALIYHDSSAIAYFGNQLDGVLSEQFCGNEYRVSEFTGALLRVQLQRLDGILADLRRNKASLAEKLSARYAFAPSNDIEGDCGTTLPLRFDSEEETLNIKHMAKEKGISLVRPYDTGKHVYTNWTPIMNKKGALNPAFDPFKMEANRSLRHNYTPDMCEKSLDILRRTAYISIDPDWDIEFINTLADELIGL